MNHNEIDLSLLPEEGRKSLRNYYEFLLERYRQREEDSGHFEPTNYRGALDLGADTERKLEAMREEWNRNVR